MTPAEHLRAAQSLSAHLDSLGLVGFDGIEVFSIVFAAYVHGLTPEPRQQAQVLDLVRTKSALVLETLNDR